MVANAAAKESSAIAKQPNGAHGTPTMGRAAPPELQPSRKARRRKRKASSPGTPANPPAALKEDETQRNSTAAAPLTAAAFKESPAATTPPEVPANGHAPFKKKTSHRSRKRNESKHSNNPMATPENKPGSDSQTALSTQPEASPTKRVAEKASMPQQPNSGPIPTACNGSNVRKADWDTWRRFEKG